jgi:hypothetical protein
LRNSSRSTEAETTPLLAGNARITPAPVQLSIELTSMQETKAPLPGV